MKQKNDILRIQKFLEEIEWMFSINNFERSIVVKDQDVEKGVSAEIYFEERYQRMTLTLYPCFFKHTLLEQRKIIIHELCHTITLSSKQAPYDLLDGKLVTPDRITEVNEIETSKIENILNSLLDGKLKYAKQAYDNYLKVNKK